MVLPGLDEAMAFDELLKHLENPDWDVIVFDTASLAIHSDFGSARNNRKVGRQNHQNALALLVEFVH